MIVIIFDYNRNYNYREYGNLLIAPGLVPHRSAAK